MRSFLTVKILAVSVSIWMAGGCLFGCTGTAMAAQTEHEAHAVVAGESCHAKKKVASHSKQPQGVPSFVPAPRGMMKDCPLVVNATAAVSKNTSHVPAPGRGPVSILTLTANNIELVRPSRVVPYLPNRGPTHLRCCVFLI